MGRPEFDAGLEHAELEYSGIQPARVDHGFIQLDDAFARIDDSRIDQPGLDEPGIHELFGQHGRLELGHDGRIDLG